MHLTLNLYRQKKNTGSNSDTNSPPIGQNSVQDQDNTKSPPIGQNSVQDQDNSSTDSLYAEPSVSSVVNNQDESFFVPILHTPILTVLSLLYNWHKMGVLFPLLYYFADCWRILYSYVFYKKQ